MHNKFYNIKTERENCDTKESENAAERKHNLMCIDIFWVLNKIFIFVLA